MVNTKFRIVLVSVQGKLKVVQLGKDTYTGLQKYW